MAVMVTARLPIFFVWKAGRSIIRRLNAYGVKKGYNCRIATKNRGGYIIRTVLSFDYDLNIPVTSGA